MAANPANLATTATVLAVSTLLSHGLAKEADEFPRIAWTQVSAQAGGAKGSVELPAGDILATRTAWGRSETRVVCARSADRGTNWQDLSVIVAGGRADDLGDGHLVWLREGVLLFSYRHNHPTGEPSGRCRYSIRVAASHDAGKTWRSHSVVARSARRSATEPRALRGLWSSFLLQKQDGVLQCYYDDEDTPHRRGFLRHQWVTMKTWDPDSRVWSRPVTVSRAHDPKFLSRDGMASVVELPSGRLVCAIESVQTLPPHANCIRMVTSDDGGRTWSWLHDERPILHQSPKPNHLCVSPWLARKPGGELLCVFATDEDRPVPGRSGTPPWQLHLDLKCVFSGDGGHSWSREASGVFTTTHRTYVPGILPLRDGSLLVTCQDFSTTGYRALRGDVDASGGGPRCR
jgi:hypothetical protein